MFRLNTASANHASASADPAPSAHNNLQESHSTTYKRVTAGTHPDQAQLLPQIDPELAAPAPSHAPIETPTEAPSAASSETPTEASSEASTAALSDALCDAPSAE